MPPASFVSNGRNVLVIASDLLDLSHDASFGLVAPEVDVEGGSKFSPGLALESGAKILLPRGSASWSSRVSAISRNTSSFESK